MYCVCIKNRPLPLRAVQHLVGIEAQCLSSRWFVCVHFDIDILGGFQFVSASNSLIMRGQLSSYFRSIYSIRKFTQCRGHRWPSTDVSFERQCVLKILLNCNSYSFHNYSDHIKEWLSIFITPLCTFRFKDMYFLICNHLILKRGIHK